MKGSVIFQHLIVNFFLSIFLFTHNNFIILTTKIDSFIVLLYCALLF